MFFHKVILCLVVFFGRIYPNKLEIKDIKLGLLHTSISL